MKTGRRGFLSLVVGVLGLPACSDGESAEGSEVERNLSYGLDGEDEPAVALVLVAIYDPFGRVIAEAGTWWRRRGSWYTEEGESGVDSPAMNWTMLRDEGDAVGYMETIVMGKEAARLMKREEGHR